MVLSDGKFTKRERENLNFCSGCQGQAEGAEAVRGYQGQSTRKRSTVKVD